MNTPKKRLLQAGMLMLGMGWLVGRAEAYKVTDSILLNVAPNNAEYSVSIASVSLVPGYDFGPVNLAATTASTAAIVVTNDGTLSEFFSLKTESTDGGWDPVTVTPAIDEFRLVGIFKATQPTASDYAVSGSTVTAVFPNPAGAMFGQASTRTTPLVSNTKNLWLSLTMPSDVTTGSNGQTMKLFVNAQGL